MRHECCSRIVYCSYLVPNVRAGTLMLAGGIDLNTVQQILGHSVASTTLNVYGHVLKGRKEEAIRSIDTALNRGKASLNVSNRPDG